jgi:hypothetical protein
MTFSIRNNKRRCNNKWTIQRHWQHWAHKAQDEDQLNNKTQHRKLERRAAWIPPKHWE